MSGDYVLETRGLTKEFKGFVAVKDVNLRVERGTIHALIGPNGAGKTTCFNLLTQFVAPTRGRIFYKAKDITGSKPSAVARMGVVRSTIEMGRNLGLSLVAEGVEDEVTLALLRGWGCDVAQGYHLSRPLDLDAVLPWLGDVMATPAWLPFRNVISLGDIVVLVGGAVLLHVVCASRLGRARHTRVRRPQAAPSPVGPSGGE